MGQVIKPVMYEPLLDTKQTEQGIKLIKDFFQQNLSTELRLRRVTAPLFVLKGLGINEVVAMYYPLHEADLSKFATAADNIIVRQKKS